jgi:glycosyltransferase involved in cell wall biosynthesis
MLAWDGCDADLMIALRARRSHAMVISSVMEGGAHAVSESIGMGVPVIASRIAGNIGLPGDDYSGYFPVGDENALASLMARAQSDAGRLQSLRTAVAKRRKFAEPQTERRALQTPLDELIGGDAGVK